MKMTITTGFLTFSETVNIMLNKNAVKNKYPTGKKLISKSVK